MDGRGGKRTGAGRPATAGIARDQHQVRSTPEEWQIIKAFADFVKAGNLQQAKKIVDQFKK